MEASQQSSPGGNMGEESGENIELTPEQAMMLQQQMMMEGQYDEEGEFEGEYMEEGEEGEYYMEEGEDGEEMYGEQMEEQEDMQDQQGEEMDQQFQDSQQESANKSPQQMEKKMSDDESFEADDDTLRKIRRDLLENLNRERRDRDMQPLYLELLTNMIAMDYAQFLRNNNHDEKFYDKLLKQYNVIGGNSTSQEIYQLCYIVAKYEEDVEITRQSTYNYFMEMGYLFLEVEQDKQHLLDSKMNHIGLGVDCDETQIIIVLIVSMKYLSITRISQGESNTIEIKGKMLDDKAGIYAIKVYSLDTNKEIKTIGPEKIDYQRQTKEFIGYLDGIELDTTKVPQKYIEFYTRSNPDSIPYKKITKEKLNLRFVDLRLRVPCMVYPDPKYIEEDEQEHLRQEAEIQAKKDEIKKQKEEKDAKKLKANIVEDEKQGGGTEGSENNEEDDQDKMDDESHKSEQEEKQIKKPDQKEPVISNKEIKEDLEMAINDSQRQHDEFMELNIRLQEKIKQLRAKQDVFVDKSNEMAMNEHKYLNTLAHVHQIRLDLKQTQDRYNKMAQDLQVKLEEKQKKCNEIKLAFLELKREVARKAAFSRNDKPIPEKQISEWEEQEIEKSKLLQELRLDILRLRNTYVKNQKILKKKEELAEGLHLIDFEQLKIENQTLNEKIEERNEDLHKLKKKNTTTVQILTHTREKLGFVQKKDEELKKVNLDLDNELGQLREKLSQLKRDKDQVRAETLRLKQTTGIVRSALLRNDFKSLEKTVLELGEEKKKKQAELENMQRVIIQFENLRKQQEGSQMKGRPNY